MASSADVTIITVAHNSAAPLAGMLASVPQDTPVVVVDNGSSDADALAQVVATHPLAQLMTAPTNLGFGRACNLGAAQAHTDYLLFLNPDTRLTAASLTGLVQAAADHPHASAFNPVLRDEDGHVRFKRRNALRPRLGKMAKPMPSAPFEANVLVGAAIFMARDAFTTVGGFDEDIFLYFEDDDLSARLQDQVGPVMIVPGVEVIHARGASSDGDAGMSPFKSWHFGYARVLTGRKHGVPFAATKALAVAGRKLLTPGGLTRSGSWASRWALLRGTWAAILGRPAGPRGTG